MATIGISGPSSYVPVGNQFYLHWGDVDQALGAGNELVLAGYIVKSSQPITRTVFKQWYDDLLLERTAVSSLVADVDLAKGSYEDRKAQLILRQEQLHMAVRGNAPKSRYDRSLPAQVQLDDTVQVIQDAMVRVRQVWTSINADAQLGIQVPVTLEGGLDLAGFLQLLNGIPGATPEAPPIIPGLRHLYDKVAELEGKLKLARESRNDLQDRLYEMMKNYRPLAGRKFPPDHALNDSMPALTPPQSTTPPAVQIVVTYDVPLQKAKIVVVGTVPAGVNELEVRGVPGSTYVADDESTLGTIPLNGPLEFLTDTFHQTAGQSATYKVFTGNASGGEAGSNAGTATRPV